MTGAAPERVVYAFSDFREMVIGTLRRARQAHAATRIFVLYDQGRGDPLNWLEDKTRSTLVFPILDIVAEKRPRLIELDCRRSAPYMLETDPALDDPWLEASVTHAYRYVVEAPLALEDDPKRAIRGLFATIDPAIHVVRRFMQTAHHMPTRISGMWAWHDPAAVAHLWETMTPLQKGSLLGPNTTWVGLDAVGRLFGFAAGASANPLSQPAHLSAQQLERARRVPMVNRLLGNWYASAPRVPDDAIKRLHDRLEHPLASGLDGPDLAAFALATIELADSFGQDSRWQRLMQEPRAIGALGDALQNMPAEAWTDHLPQGHRAVESLK